MAGLRRELEEETGAANIRVTGHYGYVEEFRPHGRAGYDVMHMASHFHTCEVDVQLGDTRMKHYERDNGMRPLRVDVDDAIAHNRAVMQRREQRMGLSIHRETFMLEHVARELLADHGALPTAPTWTRSIR